MIPATSDRQGWCRLVPVLRRPGFRTRAEIDHERDALGAIRGDAGRIADGAFGSAEPVVLKIPPAAERERYAREGSLARSAPKRSTTCSQRCAASTLRRPARPIASRRAGSASHSARREA